MSSFDITEEHFYYGTDMLLLSYQSPGTKHRWFWASTSCTVVTICILCLHVQMIKTKKKLLVQIRKSKQWGKNTARRCYSDDPQHVQDLLCYFVKKCLSLNFRHSHIEVMEMFSTTQTKVRKSKKQKIWHCSQRWGTSWGLELMTVIAFGFTAKW